MSSSKDFQWIGESLEKLVEMKRQQYQRNGFESVPPNFTSEKNNQLDSTLYQEFDVVGSDEDISNCNKKFESNGSTFDNVNSVSPIDGPKCQQGPDERSNSNGPQENLAFESTMVSNGYGIRNFTFMESGIEDEDEEGPNFQFDTTADHESYKQSLEVCYTGPELLQVDDNNNINDAFLRSPQPQSN